MASGLYKAWIDSAFTGSGQDVTTVTMKVILIDGDDYTADLDNDDFLNDIAAAARVSEATIANVSFLGGVMDGNDVTLSSVSGDQSEELVIYYDSGVESTSELFALFESGDVTGLPVTPNGNDIDIEWNASGIVSIG